MAMARRRRVVALVADDIVGDRAVIYAAEERHVCDDQKIRALVII